MYDGYEDLLKIFLGWVYPVVTHWAWDPVGWTKFIYCSERNTTATEDVIQTITENVECTWIGYLDFAGSGIVHVFGAVCALTACYFMGPRSGRFTGEGKAIDMPGHSVPLSALGGFILLFGFLAFNGGSQVKRILKP